MTNNYIIDTNTLISSLLIKNSVSHQAIEKASRLGSLLFSEETFIEFELVLFRKKFDRYLTQDERLSIIELIYHQSDFVQVTSNIEICRDPKDDKFLNLATEANASCIITGDKDLLILNPFKGIPILCPADFLNHF